MSSVLSPEAEGALIARRSLEEFIFSDTTPAGSKIKLSGIPAKADSQVRLFIATIRQWLSRVTINGDEWPAGRLPLATPTERTQAVLKLVAGKIIAAVSTKKTEDCNNNTNTS
jgi:hypothetical protein